MGLVFIVFGVVLVLAAAIGPLSVLMGVDRVCGPSEKVGEHDPIPVMRVSTSEASVAPSGAGNRAGEDRNPRLPDPIEAMEGRGLRNRHE